MESCKATRWTRDCLLTSRQDTNQARRWSCLASTWRLLTHACMQHGPSCDIELKRNVAQLIMRTTSSQHMSTLAVAQYFDFSCSLRQLSWAVPVLLLGVSFASCSASLSRNLPTALWAEATFVFLETIRNFLCKYTHLIGQYPFKCISCAARWILTRNLPHSYPASGRWSDQWKRLTRFQVSSLTHFPLVQAAGGREQRQ